MKAESIGACAPLSSHCIPAIHNTTTKNDSCSETDGLVLLKKYLIRSLTFKIIWRLKLWSTDSHTRSPTNWWQRWDSSRRANVSLTFYRDFIPSSRNLFFFHWSPLNFLCTPVPPQQRGLSWVSLALIWALFPLFPGRSHRLRWYLVQLVWLSGRKMLGVVIVSRAAALNPIPALVWRSYSRHLHVPHLE